MTRQCQRWFQYVLCGIMLGLLLSPNAVPAQAGSVPNTLATIPPAPVRGYANDLRADVVLGKNTFGEISPNTTVANRLFYAKGAIVDRSNPSDNKLYIYDGGNSRILEPV